MTSFVTKSYTLKLLLTLTLRKQVDPSDRLTLIVPVKVCCFIYTNPTLRKQVDPSDRLILIVPVKVCCFIYTNPTLRKPVDPSDRLILIVPVKVCCFIYTCHSQYRQHLPTTSWSVSTLQCHSNVLI